MRAKDVMTHHTATCSPSADLEQVSLSMWNGDFGIVPVVNNEQKVIGVITDRDVAMASALQHRPASQIRVEEVIGAQQVALCHPDDDIEQILRAMEKKKVRRMPVVDSQGQISGIVALADIIAYSGDSMSDACSSDRLVKALKSIATPHAEREKMLSSG